MWILPLTFSPSARVLQDWNSESASLFEALAQSATWRGKHTRQRFWSHAWKRVPWFRHLCGRIYEPSTGDPIVGLWISSLRASRVSHGPAPGDAKASPMSAGSGHWYAEPFGKFARRRSFLRTSPLLFGEDLDPSSVIFPRSGSMRTGTCLEPVMSALRTSGNGSSCWPTPTATELSNSLESYRAMKANMKSGPRTAITHLAQAAEAWPTPTVQDGIGSRRHGYMDDGRERAAKRQQKATLTGHSGTTLTDAAQSQWQTPGTDSFRGRGGDRKDEAGLDRQARQLWFTPDASAHRGTQNVEDAKAQGHAQRLQDQARWWATPRAEDAECCGNHPNKQDSLTGQTKRWPSSTSTSTSRSAPTSRTAGTSKTGASTSKASAPSSPKWSTPSARDWKDTEGMEPEATNADGSTRSRVDQLGRQVLLTSRAGPPSLNDGQPSLPLWPPPARNQGTTWPTPTAPGDHGVGDIQEWGGSKNPFRHQQPRRLNPLFVEWMMGWPLGWTSLTGWTASAPAATASSPSRPPRPTRS